MTTQLNPLQALQQERGVLLADGATGTTLFQLGLNSGDAPELWNDTEPEKVRTLHRGFVEAGSDIILTNSFGGTAQRLKLHAADHRVIELNTKAAQLARQVADKSSRPIIVAGSVGPTGELFEPMGELTHDTAVAAFTEQIKGLKAGGADVAWIETMSSTEEIIAAACAAIAVDLPYCYTASFDTAGKTMMGLNPSDTPAVCADLNVQPTAMGANCGVGAPDTLAAMLDFKSAAPDGMLIVKGNCGIPQFHGTEIVYTGTPELMARYATLAMDIGATIIGGCCGTTAQHIAAMRAAIDSHAKGAQPSIEQITAQLGALVNNVASQTKKVKPTRGRRRRKG